MYERMFRSSAARVLGGSIESMRLSRCQRDVDVVKEIRHGHAARIVMDTAGPPILVPVAHPSPVALYPWLSRPEDPRNQFLLHGKRPRGGQIRDGKDGLHHRSYRFERPKFMKIGPEAAKLEEKREKSLNRTFVRCLTRRQGQWMPFGIV
ncbi:hypothetical protein BDV98DRAFT_627865 [Pterulicium gracile]|uniref:Uncharacterized protein n=1 Tax=Pterulicium gracile TaxID=1884261 RepID=A0A5C3QBE3_9AGAR|nr:hypothetical protein BDV98DRAFT_627865 [Pterula gracilis]